MKLCTYSPHSQAAARVGALLSAEGSEFVVDLRVAHARLLRSRGEGDAAEALAAARIPAAMLELLRAGPPAMQAAREALAHAQRLLDTPAGAAPLVAQGLLQPLAQALLLAPIPRPGKIVGVGANYREHIQEGRDSGALGALPPYPPAFLKMPSAVIGPEAPIPYPVWTAELDYEVELCIVIGRACQDVPAARWLDVVAGFTIANDLSMRDEILREKDTGIVLAGKNFPGACPLGPVLVTPDGLRDPDDLAITLRVNGETRQRDRTRSMIHSCAAIVAWWSRLGLEPGDVLTTGTPGGAAGFGRRHPQRLLKPGDVIEAEIEGIGVLRNTVVAAAAPA